MFTYSFNRAVWKTYGFWAFWVGIIFFSIYPTCNWLTSKRSHPLALYIDPELSIPFVPEFVWMYFSMYFLFLAPPFFLGVSHLKVLGKQLVVGTILSGIFFIIFPTNLGFGRVAPDNSFYGSLFSNLFAIDLPHNMVPSLHVVFSALILLLLADTSQNAMVKFFWWTWLVLICVSTLLVHQHHILDVIAALALASFCRSWIQKGEIHV